MWVIENTHQASAIHNLEGIFSSICVMFVYIMGHIVINLVFYQTMFNNALSLPEIDTVDHYNDYYWYFDR